MGRDRTDERSTGSAGAEEEVLYRERRGPGVTVGGLLISLAGVFAFSLVRMVVGAGSDPVGRWLAPLLPLGMLIFFWWFSWSRWGPSWKHVVVSRSGLLVGREFLPAGRIGDVRLVESLAAKKQSFTGRLGGKRVGYSTYGWMASDGHGVMVEDIEGGARPLWLFASDDPIGVIEALDLVTRRRRQSWELELPDPHGWLTRGAERSRQKGRRRYDQRKATRD